MYIWTVPYVLWPSVYQSNRKREQVGIGGIDKGAGRSIPYIAPFGVILYADTSK